MSQPALRVIDHPAVADRLARLRDKHTAVPVFRALVEEIGAFLAYEATRELPVRAERVETPLEPAIAYRFANRPVVAPILRAGLGLLPGFLRVCDDPIVAHLGFYRDPATLQPVPYYANVPPDLSQHPTFVLDPMLATGNSAVAALDVLTACGARDLTFACAIASPEGVRRLHAAHPDVRVFACALDDRLNERGYILPGLGDAGDRMFGSLSSVPIAVTVRD
ncbi:MAG: uracil phosphoribosyltransferase [Vulcanimicrobiaceae bacterium]